MCGEDGSESVTTLHLDRKKELDRRPELHPVRRDRDQFAIHVVSGTRSTFDGCLPNHGKWRQPVVTRALLTTEAGISASRTYQAYALSSLVICGEGLRPQGGSRYLRKH